MKQLGHFCHVKISVNGRSVWASGAEDRTFYIHLVEWNDIYGCLPRDIIPALGWRADGNGYAYLKDGVPVYADSRGETSPVPENEINEKWIIDGKYVTLIQKGVCFMGAPFNHYYAMVNKDGKAIVTLPVSTTIDGAGHVSGLSNAASMWNGCPPPWCEEIVEVESQHRWSSVRDDQKRTLWSRRGKKGAQE